MFGVAAAFLIISDDESDEDNCQNYIPRRCLRDISNPLEMETTQFHLNFRLTKEAFAYVLQEIEGRLRPRTYSNAVPNIIKLAAALRFFAQGSYQLSVGNDATLACAQPTISVILSETLKAMESALCSKWINAVYTDIEKSRANMAFFQASGFPGVLGCVDGTHVKIIAPKKDLQHLYFNRKGYFSINALIMCDDLLNIRYVNAKHSGATHDSKVFDMSGLQRMLKAKYDAGERNTWLLGDAGYALAPYLLTPFRNCEPGSPQSHYNKQHSRARNIVERTIGLLKSRFRCLLSARALHYSPQKATQIINVCAALHNICIHYKVPNEEVDEMEHNDNLEEFLEPAEGQLSEERAVAEDIRRRVMNCLQSLRILGH